MKALALKYRPKNFDALIGQDVIAQSLSHALDSGRLGHAYLFSGLRGSGKTSSARIFAKALLCERGVSSHPCEICESCKMANEGRHLDIIEMDAASHRKIDDIRELIEQTKYAPSSARFKIFIIDEVHMLTKEAFNALLKTLEEPPEYIKFILATTDPLKLPTTILSRTQHFRFKPISKHDIIKHLEYILSSEGIKYEPGALEILSRSGSGSLRDTLTLLDQAIIYSREFVSEESVAQMLGILDPKQIDEILEVVASRDKIALSKLVATLSNSDAQMIIDELIANLKIKFVSENSKFPLLIFERFFRILSEAKNSLFLGADPEFTLYITLFMMIEAFNFTSIDDAIQAVKNAKLASVNSDVNTNSQVNSPVQIPKKTPYEIFKDKIYDRNYELGKTFDECVNFVEFTDGVLTLASDAEGENQIRLRNSSKAIMAVLGDVFGPGAKIKIQKANSAQDAMQRMLKSTGISLDDTSPKVNSSVNSQINSSKDMPVNSLSTTANLQENLEENDNTPKINAAASLELNSNLTQLSKLFGEPKIVKN